MRYMFLDIAIFLSQFGTNTTIDFGSQNVLRDVLAQAMNVAGGIVENIQYLNFTSDFSTREDYYYNGTLFLSSTVKVQNSLDYETFLKPLEESLFNAMNFQKSLSKKISETNLLHDNASESYVRSLVNANVQMASIVLNSLSNTTTNNSTDPHDHPPASGSSVAKYVAISFACLAIVFIIFLLYFPETAARWLPRICIEKYHLVPSLPSDSSDAASSERQGLASHQAPPPTRRTGRGARDVAETIFEV